MKKDYIAFAKEALKIEASSLLSAVDTIGNEFNEAIAMIMACQGKLIVTGVGKSGLIGAKIAATFASTGTPSFFLHPTEALHGDLGMIDKNDIVLAISYSGESEELSSILPHVKRFNIPLIGMTGSENSTLGQFSDIIINISVEKEACPLDIAPTSSTTLTLAMGDSLAICLMRARNFQKEDFASFHPGGALGKQLFVKVKDLMRQTDLPLITQTTTMKEAIVRISEGRLGTAVLVDDEQKLLGLLSDGDVRRALLKEDFSLDDSAKKYATLEPKVLDNEELLASDALVMIENYKIQLLAVTDKLGKVRGVLHLHTLVEAGIS